MALPAVVLGHRPQPRNFYRGQLARGALRLCLQRPTPPSSAKKPSRTVCTG